MSNHPNRSRNKIREAQDALRPALDQIIDLGGRCMEQVTDKANGILVERWLLPNGKSVIVYGTPLLHEVFEVVAGDGRDWFATINGIRRIAGVGPIERSAALYDELADRSEGARS
jgi:hypothetical protein